MLQAYSPQPLEIKPAWFNGFIKLHQYSKNLDWNKYIYLPNRYRENISATYRNESIHVEKNTIAKLIVEHYDSAEHWKPKKNTKTQKCAKIINGVDIINLSNNTIENHPYIIASDDYIIRPAVENDTENIKRIVELANKEIEIKIPFRIVKPWLDKGLMVVVVNRSGEIHGLQTFSFVDRQISHEPLTYISEAARGRGIWNIYHDLVVELGEAVDAKYVYNQCRPDMKVAKVYEHYGYVLQDKTVIESGHKYAVYHFPLQKEKQQTFF